MLSEQNLGFEDDLDNDEPVENIENLDLDPEKVDWSIVAQRFTKFRDLFEMTRQEFADRIGVSLGKVVGMESGRSRKSFGSIIKYCRLCNLDVRWVLTGKGNPFDSNFNEVVDPLTIKKGAGLRRSQIRKDAEEGTFSDDVFEFVMTVDEFKRKNNKTFTSLTEIFQIIQFLGYRKTDNRMIHIDCI